MTARVAVESPAREGPALFPRDRERAPDELADFRLRVQRFALVSFCIEATFSALSVLFRLVDPSNGAPAEWGDGVADVVAIGALFWVSRSRRLGRRGLERLDAAATVTLGLSLASVGVDYNPLGGVEVGLLFMTVALLFGRSVLVPSSWRRTLAIALLTSAPPGAMIWARQGRFFADRSPEHVFMFNAFATVGLVVMALLAAYASQVIFGLQAKARVATRLGQYTLERKLGQGGECAVYLGRHVLLRRPAAIKVLPRARLSPSRLAQFEHEVQITSALTHPNTVTLLDYGWTDDDVFYYVMEYLDGFDLEQLVRRHGPQPAWRVVHLLRQAAGALAEAHARGLLHRDVKPANLLVSERGGVPDVLHVVDFGLAVRSGGEARGGALAGTPGYLAPEAIERPDGLDGRSDLYALGAVAYWLLTGSPVFDAPSVADLCLQHLGGAPEPPSLRAPRPLPSSLEALVLACLAKDPAARPPSAASLLASLDAVAREVPFDVDHARAFWSARRDELERQPEPGVTSTLHVDLEPHRDRGRPPFSPRAAGPEPRRSAEPRGRRLVR